jgi:MSHA biogenesis protein MshE
MARPEKIRLGDLLVQQKLITTEQLQFALDQQKRSGRKLGRVLVENAFVTEDQISEALAKQLNIPFINLRHYNVNLEIVRRLPENQARRFRCIVLDDVNRVSLVGMTDPTDMFAYDEISRILRCDIDLAVVTEGQLLETLDRVYRHTEELGSLARVLSKDAAGISSATGEADGQDEAQLIKLFDEAMQMRASDIHIEPQHTGWQIRFRIDGALHLQSGSDSKTVAVLLPRLKQMAGLEISAKQVPQDGRFSISVRNQIIDVCIAILPAQYGESVVLRLLNRSSGIPDLEKLGIPLDMLNRYREIIGRSSGMVVVTGPDGSGKTTTQYASLSGINAADKKMIAVETQPEYQLPGIVQVPVNENAGIPLSNVLHAVMRQDPDVILFGESLDAETVLPGLRAAMTGHLVFATLHSRDAADALLRLTEMEAPGYMVASSVQAVIAQRLLRRVCQSCSEPYSPTVQEGEWLGHAGLHEGSRVDLKHGRGCPLCNGSGYAGRMAIFEMLEMTGELADALAHEKNAHFMQVAREHMKGKTLFDAAIMQLTLGVTTVAEVMRIANQLEAP